MTSKEWETLGEEYNRGTADALKAGLFSTAAYCARKAEACFYNADLERTDEE